MRIQLLTLFIALVSLKLLLPSESSPTSSLKEELGLHPHIDKEVSKLSSPSLFKIRTSNTDKHIPDDWMGKPSVGRRRFH
jgi:hypothetical protein